jgi:D-alanyl-D-alanine carboxypeptidase (penicillin-binding protein 5/6)
MIVFFNGKQPFYNKLKNIIREKTEYKKSVLRNTYKHGNTYKNRTSRYNLCIRTLASFSILFSVLLQLFTFTSVYSAPYVDIAILNDDNEAVGPVVKSPSTILIEAERGQVLYHKSPNLKLHISVANKIMTAVLAIEKGNLESKVTISKESTSSEGSVLFLTVGEKYTVEDLLNAIIITNANDAAIALAEHIGGDIDKFVEMMNNKAKELKMDNTYFANPTGLSNENQYTTAKDIAILIRYALTLPDFNRIFSYRAVPWINSDGVELLTNSNQLFWSYDGVDGGKTGYNKIDKQSSITTATRNSRRLIAIVLDAPENDVFTDSATLLDYGFSNFKRGILVHKNQSLQSTMVGNKEINLISISDIYYTYPIGEDYVSNVEINVNKDLSLPILKSRVIGLARYTLKDGTVIDINLYPDTDVYPPENTYTKLVNKLKEYKDLYILVIFLLVTEILVIIYKIISKIIQYLRKLKSKRMKTTEQS